jgi:L-seryl-tRNA(Ser) seleniumtransferase
MMKSSTPLDARRDLPPLDRLLSHPAVANLIPLYGRGPVRVQARRAVEELRSRLAADPPPSGEERERAITALPELVAARVGELLGNPLRRVLNATGIFLHTNLGRAPLPESVARSLPALLDAYCDLEIDLGTGRRGQRNRRAERLLTALTGAEAGLVVNNNAAALVIALAALAPGREVVVSRGELVEIGGSFRIPEIMAAAGARLVEVGATNRTRLSDYEGAIGPETALLLKVFPSNFRQTGFVASVESRKLAELGARAGIPVLVDGAGCCARTRRPSSPATRASPSWSRRGATSPPAAATSCSADLRRVSWWVVRP